MDKEILAVVMFFSQPPVPGKSRPSISLLPLSLSGLMSSPVNFISSQIY